LIGKSGQTIGAVLKPLDKSDFYLIISIGHRISLETSIKVVKRSISTKKLPIPVV